MSLGLGLGPPPPTDNLWFKATASITLNGNKMVLERLKQYSVEYTKDKSIVRNTLIFNRVEKDVDLNPGIYLKWYTVDNDGNLTGAPEIALKDIISIRSSDFEPLGGMPVTHTGGRRRLRKSKKNRKNRRSRRRTSRR